MEIGKREPNTYDTAKGIGILLMVMGHSGFKKSFEVFIYGFHMPFFFVLAGMLYDQAVWEKRGFAALARKRWRSYIAPYFVLSGINLVLNGIHEIVKYKEFEEWLKSQVLHTGWIVFANGNGSETPHCTPLWFLPCLFLSCLILYWLLRLRPVGQAVMCLVLFGVNRMFHMMIPGSRTMPWRLDVACVGAVLMLVGYYIKSCGCLRYTQKRPWTMLVFLLAGMWIDKMCGGGVALASNTIRYPAAMLLCSACMTIGIVSLSQKLYSTAIGRFFGFCGQSTLIFMGFNYFLNTVMSIIWRVLPVLNEYKFQGGFNFISVTTGLLLISLVWEKVRPHLNRAYCRGREWIESV